MIFIQDADELLLLFFHLNGLQLQYYIGMIIATTVVVNLSYSLTCCLL